MLVGKDDKRNFLQDVRVQKNDIKNPSPLKIKNITCKAKGKPPSGSPRAEATQAEGLTKLLTRKN
eukprot:1794447-Karenia_brevis.AAC.1